MRSALMFGTALQALAVAEVRGDEGRACCAPASAARDF